MRTYEVPQNLSKWLEHQIQNLGFSYQAPKVLAQAVLKLSRHFIEKSGPTPWNEPWAKAAYLAYFFPIGYARGLAVRHEWARILGHDPLAGVHRVYELGSGPGNVSAALWTAGQDWTCEEVSREAQDLHARLFQDVFGTRIGFHTSAQTQRSGRYELGLFSFVLNEISRMPDFLKFDHVVILEPATHQDFAGLLAVRERLMSDGFTILAPCTHALKCPLGGGRDWCHDRVGFRGDENFQRLEVELPMKNQTLTFSYLIASKTRTSAPAGVRLVGDLLHERGKSRILACRGPEREFLSWLHKEGPVPEVCRGEIFSLTGAYEKRGNEIRIKTRGES